MKVETSCVLLGTLHRETDGCQHTTTCHDAFGDERWPSCAPRSSLGMADREYNGTLCGLLQAKRTRQDHTSFVETPRHGVMRGCRNNKTDSNSLEVISQPYATNGASRLKPPAANTISDDKKRSTPHGIGLPLRYQGRATGARSLLAWCQSASARNGLSVWVHGRGGRAQHVEQLSICIY